MNKLLKFVKAERTSINNVEVTYILKSNDVEFKICWNNIHPETGVIHDSNNDIYFESCNDADTKELIQNAILDGEGVDDDALYIELRDTFDSSDSLHFKKTKYNEIIEKILANGGLVQDGVWIEEADPAVTNYNYVLVTDDGITDYFHTDGQLEELCPDSDYFKTEIFSIDEALNLFPAGSFDRNDDYYKDTDVAG